MSGAHGIRNCLDMKIKRSPNFLTWNEKSMYMIFYETRNTIHLVEKKIQEKSLINHSYQDLRMFDYIQNLVSSGRKQLLFSIYLVTLPKVHNRMRCYDGVRIFF